MINKLCLGTVQFGLDYGINNKNGKPSKKDVFEMMDIAIDRGITIFDTASAYGNAEELLGEYISKRSKKEDIRVISKLKPNLIDENCKNIQLVIEEEIKKTLMKTRVESLEGYLLHTPTDFYNADIMEGLEYFKKRGLIKNIGVSIYEFKHAMDVVNSDRIDYIQVPYSIFDQRMENREFFSKAKKNGIKVFARSIFLQGLITMEEDEIPEHLSHARKYLRLYDEIIKKYGVSRIEAAIHYIYDNQNIDYLVFGVDNKKQLIENIDIVQNMSIDKECIKELKEALSGIEENIIFPSLWSRK